MSLWVILPVAIAVLSNRSSWLRNPFRIAWHSRLAVLKKLSMFSCEIVLVREVPLFIASFGGKIAFRKIITIGKVCKRGSLARPLRLTRQYTSHNTSTSCFARSSTHFSNVPADGSLRISVECSSLSHMLRNIRTTKSWMATSSSRIRNARHLRIRRSYLESDVSDKYLCNTLMTRFRTLTPTSEMRSKIAGKYLSATSSSSMICLPRSSTIAERTMVPLSDSRLSIAACIRFKCNNRGFALITTATARTAAARTIMALSSSAPTSLRISTSICWVSGWFCRRKRHTRMLSARDNIEDPPWRCDKHSVLRSLKIIKSFSYTAWLPPGMFEPKRKLVPCFSHSRDHWAR